LFILIVQSFAVFLYSSAVHFSHDRGRREETVTVIMSLVLTFCNWCT